MRKTLWVVLCFVSAARLCGQTAKEALDSFQDSIKGKQLVLRNFSGEDEVHATWSGTQFELATPRWRTFGILQVSSAKLNGDELRLECTRHVGLVSQSNQLAIFEQPTKVEIVIDLGHSDPADTLPKV